jgi:predicted enzyme related to lactoylglutathione lyase
MPQHLITHLRHVDLAVPDYQAQLDFYTGAWGLKSEHNDTGLAFLAAEGSPEQYVVRLRKSDEKRVDLISFGTATPADVDTLAGRVAAAGVQLISEPGALQTPGGGYGFRFFDNEGRAVEISSDVALRQHRKIEEGETIPVRLSHVVLNSADPVPTRWYTRRWAR